MQAPDAVAGRADGPAPFPASEFPPADFGAPDQERAETGEVSLLGWRHVAAQEFTVALLFAVGWSSIAASAPAAVLGLYTLLNALLAGLLLIDPQRPFLLFRIGYVACFAALAFAINLVVGMKAGLGNSAWALYILYFMTASTPVLLFPPRLGCAIIAAIWLLFVNNVLLVADKSISSAQIVQNIAGMSTGFVFVVVFARISRRAQEQASQISLLHQRRRAMHRELQATHARLQDFTEQVEEFTAIRERNRMAQEIHDTLGHHLTVLNVQLEAALRLLAVDPERSRTQMQKAKDSAAAALHEVRASVSALKPRELDRTSLKAALERLVDDFSSATSLPVDLAITGVPGPLSAAQETTLYRAAQEALTNIQKHARAGRASVALHYGPAVELTIADDGAGSAAPRGGMGLVGIRERVEGLGGAFSIRTKPGAGMILHLSLPCHHPPNGAAGGAPPPVAAGQREGGT